jgi:hypothetical protein
LRIFRHITARYSAVQSSAPRPGTRTMSSTTSDQQHAGHQPPHPRHACKTPVIGLSPRPAGRDRNERKRAIAISAIADSTIAIPQAREQIARALIRVRPRGPFTRVGNPYRRDRRN